MASSDPIRRPFVAPDWMTAQSLSRLVLQCAGMAPNSVSTEETPSIETGVGPKANRWLIRLFFSSWAAARTCSEASFARCTVRSTSAIAPLL